MALDWLIPLLAGGARNILGWLENAFKDGKIESFEWGQLIGTVLEVVVLTFGLAYGMNLDTLQAAAGGILASFGLSAMKKAGTK